MVTASVLPPPLSQPGQQPPRPHARTDSPAPPPDWPPPAGGEPTGKGLQTVPAYCMSNVEGNRIDRELSTFPSHGWTSLIRHLSLRTCLMK